MPSISVSTARHSFSGCPCGHLEHVASGLQSYDRVRCPECDEVALRERITIAIDTRARVTELGITTGMLVRCNGQSYRVLTAVPITRLGGRYDTGYVRLKLREA